MRSRCSHARITEVFFPENLLFGKNEILYFQKYFIVSYEMEYKSVKIPLQTLNYPMNFQTAHRTSNYLIDENLKLEYLWKTPFKNLVNCMGFN